MSISKSSSPKNLPKTLLEWILIHFLPLENIYYHSAYEFKTSVKYFQGLHSLLFYEPIIFYLTVPVIKYWRQRIRGLRYRNAVGKEVSDLMAGR